MRIRIIGDHFKIVTWLAGCALTWCCRCGPCTRWLCRVGGWAPSWRCPWCDWSPPYRWPTCSRWRECPPGTWSKKQMHYNQSIRKKMYTVQYIPTRTLELQIQYNNKAPWTVADLAKISTLFCCTQIWPTILKISAKTYCVIAFRKVAEFSF